DGETFLTGSTDKTARLWDAVTGRPIGLPLIHQSALHSAAFSSDGKLLTTSDASAVRVWAVRVREVQPYQPTRLVLEHTSSCSPAALSRDGKIILTGCTDGTVWLWDAAPGHPLIPPRTEHNQRIRAVAFSPDGKIALAGSDDKTARMWAVPS